MMNLLKRCLLLIFTALLAAAQVSAQTGQKTPSTKYWPTQGWRSSSPEAQGMDSAKLAEAFDYIQQQKVPIHSLLIVRNGSIVLDAYFYPFQADQLHDGASMTKSVTGPSNKSFDGFLMLIRNLNERIDESSCLFEITWIYRN